VGVFCATPESLRSQRMLFEARALEQHGESPTLFTYLYSIDKLSGPLGQFQATHCDREDSPASVKALAQAVGRVSDARAISKFMETWDSFESRVLTRMILPVQRLVPQFPGLFENKKTFHGSFPDCSDRRWDDRLRRTVRVHEQLSGAYVGVERLELKCPGFSDPNTSRQSDPQGYVYKVTFKNFGLTLSI